MTSLDILVSLLLVAFKHEQPIKRLGPSDDLNLSTVYKQIWSIVSLPSILMFFSPGAFPMRKWLAVESSEGEK